MYGVWLLNTFICTYIPDKGDIMTLKILAQTLRTLFIIILCGIMQPAVAAVVTPGIAAGGSHTVALLTDGTVMSWGDNIAGQLGNGTSTSANSPAMVTGLDGPVTAIAAGDYHTAALMADGTVRTWGDNSAGQLGNGTNLSSNVPVTVIELGGTVTAIAAGDYFTLALMTDGTVKAWGSNYYGQLGNGTYNNSNVPVTISDPGGEVTAIAAGWTHSAALLADGSVKTWGENDYGQLGNGTYNGSSTPVSVSGLGATVTAIAAGDTHTVALLGNGTVKAWGDNYYGQLGNGDDRNDSYLPVTVAGLSGTVTAVAAGDFHTVAAMADGTIMAWGDNGSGQFGDGGYNSSSLPVTTVGMGGVANSIEAGNYFTVALLADGAVKTWGDNGSGQLGNGTYNSSSTPVPVTGLDAAVTSIASGAAHSVALLENGTVKAWGNSTVSQLGSAGSSNVPLTVNGLGDTVTTIAAGFYHNVALLADGTVKSWGYNAHGQLGNGTNEDSATPVNVSALEGMVTAIAAGYAHTVALLDDGSVRSWGLNWQGQLGNATTTSSTAPVTVVGLTGPVTALAAGEYHTVALLDDGTVQTWGSNDYGQLGDGTTTSSSTPVTVTGLGGRVIAIAAGQYHTVVLLENGTVQAWGLNSFGELGIGTNANSSTPATITNMGGMVAAIATRKDHSMALLANGTVKSWGRNDFGQIGNGTTADSNTPVTVTGLEGTVTAIAAGWGHSVALLANGTVNSWGKNIYGQLGSGTWGLTPQTALINVDNVAPVVTADKPAGSYSSSLQVAISCSDNYSGCRDLYYTDDGSTPDTASLLYTGPLTISSSSTLKFLARDHAGNTSAVQSLSFTIESGSAPLTLSFAGSGSGTINYSIGGSCSAVGGCSQSFNYGTEISLTPVPLAGSYIFSWTGCDSINGTACKVIMSAERNVTATFNRMTVKSGAIPYITLAAALSSEADGATLQLAENMLPETINYTGSGILTIAGGYDVNWNRQSDTYSVIGAVIINSGTLIIDQIIIH